MDRYVRFVRPDGAPGAGLLEGDRIAAVAEPFWERAERTGEELALAGVFGYTAGNDVSARDWQADDGQWWRAKGADTFGVFGPAIATGLDHDAIEVRTRVNGEETQHGRSDEIILDIPEIVRYTASAITLAPGDVIFSGTPGQPRALTPGDVVEVEVTGAGVLRNPVVAGRGEPRAAFGYAAGSPPEVRRYEESRGRPFSLPEGRAVLLPAAQRLQGRFAGLA